MGFAGRPSCEYNFEKLLRKCSNQFGLLKYRVDVYGSVALQCAVEAN
jgi:hypothetical protein